MATQNIIVATHEFKFTADIENKLTSSMISNINRNFDDLKTAIGAAAESYAKQNTPVDTGRLRNSIRYELIPIGVRVQDGTEYGIYVEDGARGREGVHMFRDAVSNHDKEYSQIAVQWVQSMFK